MEDDYAALVEQHVKESEDAYTFTLELLGHVFRGALTADSMGQGEEINLIHTMHSQCAATLSVADPASLPIFQGRT